MCPVEIFEATLKKSIADDSIFENGHGLFLTHFDDYQFTEYDRQKPYRERAKEAKGDLVNKKCTACDYKAKTAETDCPKCGKPLEKDYKAGQYGHRVKQ